MGSVEDQKRTCPLFSGDPFKYLRFHCLFENPNDLDSFYISLLKSFLFFSLDLNNNRKIIVAFHLLSLSPMIMISIHEKALRASIGVLGFVSIPINEIMIRFCDQTVIQKSE